MKGLPEPIIRRHPQVFEVTPLDKRLMQIQELAHLVIYDPRAKLNDLDQISRCLAQLGSEASGMAARQRIEMAKQAYSAVREGKRAFDMHLDGPLQMAFTVIDGFGHQTICILFRNAFLE